MTAEMVAAYVVAYVATMGEPVSLPAMLEQLAVAGAEVHGVRTLTIGSKIVRRGLATPVRDGLRCSVASGCVHARLGGVHDVQLIAAGVKG